MCFHPPGDLGEQETLQGLEALVVVVAERAPVRAASVPEGRAADPSASRVPGPGTSCTLLVLVTVVQPFPNQRLAPRSLQCVQTLVGHTGGVWSSQMRDSVVISGSTDRTLKVWNADTGECVHTLYGHTSTVRCMHLHGNRYGHGGAGPALVPAVGHGEV